MLLVGAFIYFFGNWEAMAKEPKLELQLSTLFVIATLSFARLSLPMHHLQSPNANIDVLFPIKAHSYDIIVLSQHRPLANYFGSLKPLEAFNYYLQP
ncbi:hypothetical protein BYT27DRAFT_7262661 [Phlegmacium glaucopus]|nr:hypothetical protein BYT27DRAFT_7262661 [Phlegmacium glaucopus]